MLCDICHKNEATIHIKEIIGGAKKTLNMCSQCAGSHNAEAQLPMGAFNLAEMLYNLSKTPSGAAMTSVHAGNGAASGPVCPNCGWTLDKLKENGGKLGCAECYHTFGALIAEALPKVHRGTVHLGKRAPQAAAAATASGTTDSRAASSAALQELRTELQQAIDLENYEQAAIIRDKIREIELESEES